MQYIILTIRYLWGGALPAYVKAIGMKVAFKSESEKNDVHTGRKVLPPLNSNCEGINCNCELVTVIEHTSI